MTSDKLAAARPYVDQVVGLHTLEVMAALCGPISASLISVVPLVSVASTIWTGSTEAERDAALLKIAPRSVLLAKAIWSEIVSQCGQKHRLYETSREAAWDGGSPLQVSASPGEWFWTAVNKERRG